MHSFSGIAIFGAAILMLTACSTARHDHRDLADIALFQERADTVRAAMLEHCATHAGLGDVAARYNAGEMEADDFLAACGEKLDGTALGWQPWSVRYIEQDMGPHSLRFTGLSRPVTGDGRSWILGAGWLDWGEAGAPALAEPEAYSTLVLIETGMEGDAIRWNFYNPSTRDWTRFSPVFPQIENDVAPEKDGWIERVWLGQAAKGYSGLAWAAQHERCGERRGLSCLMFGPSFWSDASSLF